LAALSIDAEEAVRLETIAAFSNSYENKVVVGHGWLSCSSPQESQPTPLSTVSVKGGCM
jgi:hypothetical protein